jgi:hypothetical protein
MRYFAWLRPLIYVRSTAVRLFGSLTVALGLTVVGTAAEAHPDRSTVLAFGKIRCEVPNSSPRQWEAPTRVRFQTDVGEGVDAALGSVPPPPVFPQNAKAKPEDFTAEFHQIPLDGVQFNAYITCRNAPEPTWGWRGRITQRAHPHELYLGTLYPT